METVPSVPQKSKDEAKAILKDYLKAVDVEIESEFDHENRWGFFIKFGNFPVLLENQKDSQYFVVAFQILLPDDTAIKAINDFYDNRDHRFILDLTRAFTSPHTGFSRVIESGKVIGFTILKNIYPFHPGFTIKDLDEALQAVVSVGDTGIAFFKTVMGEMDLDHTTPRPVSESGPMYE
jgi:hypothetical protein